MKKATIKVSNFNRGEVSDFVFFNNDMKSENNQASKIQNLLVTPYGSLIRRSGSEFISGIYHNFNIKMISFEDSQNFFVIEVYPSFLRFYKNNQAFIKSNTHYEIKSPFKEKDIENMAWVYDGTNNKIYLFSEEIRPQTLKWDSEYNFTLEDFKYQGGPYEDINKSDATMQVDRISGNNITITASEDTFVLEDLSRYIRIAHNDVWGEAQITGFINSKEVVADVIHNFSSTEKSKYFSLGQWSKRTGYPAKAAIFNGRLYLANTKTNKRTVWVSKIWDFNDFSPITRVEVDGKQTSTVNYDNAINIKLSEGKNILWLNSNKDNLLLGTQEGVFGILPINSDEALSPYNYMINQLSAYTSSNVALSLDYFTIHSDFQSKNLYSLNITQDKLLSIQDISFYAKHLFIKGIKDILLINYPFTMVWVLLQDGSLVCATLINSIDGKVYAWHRHKLGGDDAKVLAITTTYDSNNSYLWLHIARTVDNKEQRSLEIIKFSNMEELYDFSINNKEDYYIDGYREYELKDNVIANINEFNGKKVGIITKDKLNYFNEQEVIENRVSFTKNVYEDTKVMIGYNFESIFESELIDINNSFFGLKKLTSVNLLSQNSQHLKLLVDKNVYAINESNRSSFNYNISRVNINSSWNELTKITIKQQDAYALIINGLSIDFDIQ